MNVERVIKSPNVIMGPPVMVGGGIPILQQAEAVASAAWSKFEVPKAFHTALANVNLDPGLEPVVPDPAQQFFETNMSIVSIISRFSPPRFNPQPELNATDAILEAEAIFRQVRRPLIVPFPKPKVDTILGPEPATRTDQVFHTTNPLPQQVEQLTQETEIVAKSTDQDKIRLAEQQSIEEERLINVEDWQVVEQRRFEISQAIKRAWAVVKEGRIFGWMVSRFLPGQHEGNTSQLVKRQAPDGSLVDTEQAIREDLREFRSEQQAKEGLLPYVSIYKPAKRAKEGKRLARQEVVRVVRYLLAKPSPIFEVFVKRKFKRLELYKGDNPAPALVTEQTEIEAEEPSLESNPQLAELFQDTS